MSSSAALTTTHLPLLRSEIAAWREKQLIAAGFKTSLTDIQSTDSRNNMVQTDEKDILVAFRTRPPLEREAEVKFALPESGGTDAPTEGESGAEDVLIESGESGVDNESAFCSGITVSSGEPGEFVAHVPTIKWSGPSLTHKKFTSDLAFGPEIDNEEVYQRTVVASDLLTLALSGGIACILAYGQTSSGKTYTMEGLEHRIARDLSKAADALQVRLQEAERKAFGAATTRETGDGESIFEFSATFLELLRKRAVDLLEPAEGLPVDDQSNPVRKEVMILENTTGDVRPLLKSTVFRSSEELEALIVTALSHRRTSATARNATSSRSHAVLTITVKNKLLPYAEEGQLILVDLAGSERYEDWKGHNKQQMAEVRENNKSLMNLKECVRAKAKMANEDGFVHVPWRSHKLTMLLKPIFNPESRQASKTIIIAHVSPHIQDHSHSVNTLSYASPFKISPPKPRGPAPYNKDDPRTWNTGQTREWFVTEFTKWARARRRAAEKVNARSANRLGAKPASADELTAVQIPIDVEKLVLADMTAMNILRMRMPEFVQRCLECANVGGEITVDGVCKAGNDVLTTLIILMMKAKNRTRSDIMKSRKKLVTSEVYGARPDRVIKSKDPNMPDMVIPDSNELLKYTDDEIWTASQELGQKWHDEIARASAEAREQGKNVDSQHSLAIITMMSYWKTGAPPVIGGGVW